MLPCSGDDDDDAATAEGVVKVEETFRQLLLLRCGTGLHNGPPAETAVALILLILVVVIRFDLLLPLLLRNGSAATAGQTAAKLHAKLSIIVVANAKSKLLSSNKCKMTGLSISKFSTGLYALG